MFFWGVYSPHKNAPTPSWPATHMMNLKSCPNLHAFPSPINMKLWQDRIKSFPLLEDPLCKPDHQAIHCPAANFGPLSRDSVTNSMLTTALDTYLMPRSARAWYQVWVPRLRQSPSGVWTKILLILNVAPLLISRWDWPINM